MNTIPKSRIGNPFVVRLNLYADESKTTPLPVAGRGVTVTISRMGRHYELEQHSVDGNIAEYIITPEIQARGGVGIYKLTYWEHKDQAGQRVVDSFDLVEFVPEAETVIAPTIEREGAAIIGLDLAVYIETGIKGDPALINGYNVVEIVSGEGTIVRTTMRDGKGIITLEAEHANADHTRAEDDHRTAGTDHTRAEEDHRTAGTDHARAEDDHKTAGTDHARAEDDHKTAGTDHTRAEDDHKTAGTDHTRAEEDHRTAGTDHARAGEDHRTAESDHSDVSKMLREGEQQIEKQQATFEESERQRGAEAARLRKAEAQVFQQSQQDKQQTFETSEQQRQKVFDGKEAQRDAAVAVATQLNDPVARLQRLLGYSAAAKTVTLQAGESGKYVKCATRQAASNSAFNISKPFDVEACSELFIKTGYNPSDASHASLDISVIAIYEEIERQRTVQKKNADGEPLYYVVEHSEDGQEIVTTDESTVVTNYPVYTSEVYTEKRYLPNNEDRWVAIPDTGYYVANIPQSCKVVISYKPGITDTNVITEKHGALANLTSQIFGIYEHRTMVEAMLNLAARLDALENSKAHLGNATAGSVDSMEYTSYLYPTVLRGHGTPSATSVPENLPKGLPWDGVPVFTGQLYINLDAAGEGLYYAAGVDSVGDWKKA